MTRKLVRVRDLTANIHMLKQRPMLYCPVCRTTSSAERRDYFTYPPDHVLRCPQGCNTIASLRLVVKRVIYVDYKGRPNG